VTIFSLVVTLAFAYLASQEERFGGLRAVTVAYAFNTLRFVAALADPLVGTTHSSFAINICSTLGGVFLVAGALRMGGAARWPRWLVPVGIAGIAFAAWGAYGGMPLVLRAIIFLAFGAVASWVFAWGLFRLARRTTFGGFRVVGMLAVVLGVLRVAAAFWPSGATAQIVGLMLASTVYLAIGVALITAMQRSQFLDARDAKLQAKSAGRQAQAAIDSTTDMMSLLRVEPDGRLIVEMVNPSHVKFTSGAFPDREIATPIGRDLGEFLRAELGLSAQDADAVLSSYREAARTGLPQRSIATIGGRTREAVFTPLAERDGRVTHVFYRGTDTTEQRRAANELRRSGERLARILDLAPVAISISTLSGGRIHYVNPAWCRQTGYPAGEALGRTMRELGIWAGDDRRREALLRELQAGPAQFEHSYVNRHGHTQHSLVSAMTFDHEGEQCALVIAQDVTAAAEARQRANVLTERLAQVFSLSPAPLVVASFDEGRFLEVNDAWLAFYGGRREEVIGRTAHELQYWVDPYDRDRLLGALRRGERISDFSTRFRRRDGSVADCIFRAEAIEWAGTKAIVGSLQDVTELRRLNETLEARVHERTAELEQTLGELEAFSYSVSHDLRAPLRAMSSFASLLAARSAVAGDAQAADYAERITRAAGRMAEIVNELLRYSRLARQPIETQPVALEPEVRALARELGEQVAGRRIRWEFGALPVVRADPMLLRLVLQNLMDNAVKYSRQRDEAVISVTARDDAAGNIEIAVRDNGVGFDMAHAANLFRPFQRLHDETEFEGTGIGLAHAKRIIERHGGRLWAEAAPGQGATFRFTLPR